MMIDPEPYTPGPANLAQVQKGRERWTLILVKELRHSPEKVWQALPTQRICASGRLLRWMGIWARLQRSSSPGWEIPRQSKQK